MDVGAREASKCSDVMSSRKGVVKMLIASVSVYVISYAPVQIPLFYNLVSSTPFRANWTFLVLIMTLSYINSAANPFIYSVFSHNFRYQFRRLLWAVCSHQQSEAAEAVTVISSHRQIQHHTARSAETYRMKYPTSLQHPTSHHQNVGRQVRGDLQDETACSFTGEPDSRGADRCQVGPRVKPGFHSTANFHSTNASASQ